uniref:C-type lectin domain-containing protein n=1 Tax=Lepisosteus oculatus TaxID=7918 RepID=W5MK57_LEPOC
LKLMTHDQWWESPVKACLCDRCGSALATVCLGLLWAVTLPAIIALCVYCEYHTTRTVCVVKDGGVYRMVTLSKSYKATQFSASAPLSTTLKFPCLVPTDSRGSQSGKEEHIIQSANNPQLMNELLEVRVNYSTLSAKNYRLQRDYRNLKAENTILQKEKRSLQNEKDGYQKEKAELQREITGLQSQITEMRRICTPCQQGWELFNFKCYLFSTYKLSWNESRNLCRLTESDLVIVESRKEQEFLISNLKKDNYWIGLTDTAEEGTFLWVDGSRDTRGFWDSGQPNDPNGNHDCVAIYPRSSSLNAWNDIPCSASRSWICE